ncbi:tetratricopeptide repeat protein [Acidipila sp. EB88]|uniref:tetratricopeptide repeat-containing glycosyltransferase family protein n=1 Tax=Acidipila sp. EB88 TaxID=2305226 RepID=UPI001F376891|nr:tetratricopeptide repeat-containing glycosyltransferase family protein [Acidipila sp. EB88]
MSQSWAEAADALARTLSLAPARAELWNDLGICLHRLQQPAAAIQSFLHALLLDPRLAVAHNNLGSVLKQEGDLDGAMEQFEAARAIDPLYAEACSNLATVHRDRGNYAAAVSLLRNAVALEPRFAAAHSNLGEVLSLIAEADAEEHLQSAVKLEPDNALYHWNLGVHLLRSGNYEAGWPHYQWRWKWDHYRQAGRTFTTPCWLGDFDIQGRTVLIHAEQGLGDTIQFLRYLPLVFAAGAQVILEIQPLLCSLVQRLSASMPGLVAVVKQGEAAPPADCHTPLLSLPLACGTTGASIPPPLPFPDAAGAETFPAKKYGVTLRVGLAWAGDPTHRRDHERSIPLALFAPLSAVPGVELVSLQVGAATSQIAHCGFALETPTLATFCDTAAVLASLDLVISVDTAVAHLAATQNLATWILLPRIVDWRWLAPPSPQPEIEGSPWYPSARLFRQAELPVYGCTAAGWEPVIARVVAALQQYSAPAMAEAPRTGE